MYAIVGAPPPKSTKGTSVARSPSWAQYVGGGMAATQALSFLTRSALRGVSAWTNAQPSETGTLQA